MKNLLFMLIALAGSFTVLGQDGPDEMRSERMEKLEMLKRTYIAERLNLTTTEAEKFWPVFNEMELKKKAIRKTIKESSDRLNSGAVSDKALTETLELITAKRKEEADIDRDFVKACIPILGVAKAAKLVGMEEDFKRKLMDELRERKEEGRPGPRGRR